MFEDSLFSSRVGEVSSRKRWTFAASIGLQTALAGVVMVLPLLHPEALPFHVEAPRVLVPLLKKPSVPVLHEERTSSASFSAMPSVATESALPSLFKGRQTAVGDAPALSPIVLGMQGDLPSAIADGNTHSPLVSVRPVKPTGPISISTGVTQGLLLAPIQPVYPAIAKAAHVEGSVVVEAIISKTGTIESLHVLSGPAMLQNAALDAIRQARYRPYRLNGEPTEVQTTITVNFRIGG
jgi:periplasmic protein TonB